ncbi:hypothetical protein PENPOL_c003G01633 [Penicillium polonicum]|uniref:Uncharacterized protein n=1 Tax=Penicillium polonicum TaxID=60169 RepID=A0A1V6NUD1_PENPO|nr:hypothetical protein PENPOL_c003G01633 [Penicillium polonicum]
MVSTTIHFLAKWWTLQIAEHPEERREIKIRCAINARRIKSNDLSGKLPPDLIWFPAVAHCLTYRMLAHVTVSTKDSGPTEIFRAILGGPGVFDIVRASTLFAKAAKARRATTPEHTATLGGDVKGGMAQIDKLKHLCC